MYRLVLSPPDVAAITVAMTIAPGVFARNRMFEFHEDPGVRRAKRRAAELRGLVHQLTGASGPVDRVEIEHGPGKQTVLSYTIPRLRLSRRVELTELETACVAYLASRAGARVVPAGPEQRARLRAALRRLASGLGVVPPDMPPEFFGTD